MLVWRGRGRGRGVVLACLVTIWDRFFVGRRVDEEEFGRWKFRFRFIGLWG